MRWDEFKTLLTGLNPDTALGRVVAIRSETNKDVLKEFTPDMRRMRNEWINRNAKNKSLSERDAFVEEMRKAFIAMAGGESSARE
jgi:hypothetical protein